MNVKEKEKRVKGTAQGRKIESTEWKRQANYSKRNGTGKENRVKGKGQRRENKVKGKEQRVKIE